MKLASWFHNNLVTCGIATDEGLIDIALATENQPKNRLHSVKEILIKGPSALKMVQEIADTRKPDVSFDQVRWLPPIPRPGKLLALAGNYMKHLGETGGDNPLPNLQEDRPPIRPFLMPQTAAIGHQTRVHWPLYSRQVDHEIELAILIGKTARAVSPKQAKEAIAGYTIANDISARSVTVSKRPHDAGKDFYEWLMGKWSDGFLPLGPWMVTADEIPDPHNLKMTLTVNGQVRQDSATSEMIYSAYEIVSFLSQLITLEPGDVIATGTPHGVGAATGNYLQPGDKIDCTIEGIGTLSNSLGPQPDPFYAGLS